MKNPSILPFRNDITVFISAKKQLAEDLRQQAAKIAAKKADAEKRAAQLDGVELVITAKVSATGVTYGSVNTAIVAEELAKKGIEIDRKIITMRDIKKVGTFEATIHFFKDVEVKLPVTVVAENQPEPKAEEVKETVEAPVEEVETVEEEAPAAE